MVKVTLADIEQMSDSQRILFNAGVVFERERVLALLTAWVNDDNGDFDKTLIKIKKGR